MKSPMQTADDIAEKSWSFLKEFREFAMRGNIVDLAIGVMIGAAFNKIVTSLVNDIVMPPIGLLLGRVNFANLFIELSAENDVRINYGVFLNTLLEFLIIATVTFLIVRQLNRMRRRGETPPTTKECPFCVSVISVKAVRCPHCTSEVQG